MKKSKISFIASFLVGSMLLASLTACKTPTHDDETTDTTSSAQSEVTTESTTTTETETASAGEETQTEAPVIIEGEYADTIMAANKLADGVQAYYNAARTKYTVTNNVMSLEYPLTSAEAQLVTAIRNTKGNAYVENTMDVFVTMDNGKTYYASTTTASARANIYKLGYYYYDVHFLDQDFYGASQVAAVQEFDLRSVSGKHDIDSFKMHEDHITYTVSGSDPYVYTAANKKYSFSADEYNAVQFTMKVTKSNNGELYFVAGDYSGHSADQKVSFKLIADGEWHTYTVILENALDYTNSVNRLRFDVGSSEETIGLKDIKAVKVVTSDAPALSVDRTFHTYSDKMNQVLHFVATKETTGIAALGMITEIPADKVAKLIVKDAKGLHETIDGVDWDSAEYIGFDIKDAGIFGYILLQHENSGKLTVTLEDGVYVITQSSAPKDGKIIPPNAKVTYTNNDFYMGQRLYNDESHSFDAFLIEAEYERNPLETISGETYLGYDALRGAYKFSIGGTGFNEPFFTYWNRHYKCDVTVQGGDTDRNIYIYTYHSGGCGEGAALLSEDDLLLPVPVMIYKNFGGENEEPVFFAGDHTYSETYFPLVIKAGETTSVKVLNLYMNWGQYPLKQLSSIQYFWPYYHLSIGTTETSCISPWYGARDLWTLPDFRSMSMPYWFELEGDSYSNQPQHTHGGYQYFLQYTDADGNYNATENYNNNIISSGPVYAEVDMDYISDDGKIKVSYTHLEFAQTDELRAYYEIEYEILEEVTIADFKNDFSFYSLEGYAGYYRKMGYLDENNQVAHKNTNQSSDKTELIVLGDQCPYVSLYSLYSSSANWAANNVNLGFVIYDSEFVLGGKECTENFVITGSSAKYSLSLNLDEVTLKPGDVLKINMIICPWGWYDSTDDKNMQDLRLNTCIDPLKVSVSDGEAIDSTFIPKVKSTNGKSAEFTLSGASNNVAVRVYGFEKMTAPKIYEKINGEWVEYAVSSFGSPDKVGYEHHYDGYNVYYDGDGTYSYAFTVNMDNVDSRTFKIVADEDFKGWPEIVDQGANDPINVYVDPEELAAAAAANTGISKAEVSADKSYTRFYGNDSNPEGFFNVFTSMSDEVTGQYLIIKYRISSEIAQKVNFQIYTSTVNAGAVAADNFNMPGCIQDGEWHILVCDMTKQGLPTFSENDGKYLAKYLRLDIFSCKMPTDSYVDLAYVGMSDNLDDFCKLNENKGTATYVEFGREKGVFSFVTGKVGSGSTEVETESPDLENYIDPESGWSKSDLTYRSAIDFINGIGDGDGPYDLRGGTSAKGIDILTFDGPTAGNAYLAIAGWTVIDKGVEKYMWSVDGGKTWHECVLYNTKSFATVTASNGIIGVANNLFGYDYLEYQANSIYQGSENLSSGISAHLTDYIGETVNVIFAAVPKTDTDSLCLIAYIKDVRVYESDEAAAEGEKALAGACEHKSATDYVFADDDKADTDEATIHYVCDCGEVVFEASLPAYVFFFSKIADQSVSPLVFENKYDYRSFNAKAFEVSGNAKSFKADANGKLYMNGWAGVNGGIGDIVIKVYDENGNLLTDGWVSTGATFKYNQSDLNPEMLKRGIEEKFGARYELTMDLAEYFASNDKITVKMALEISEISDDFGDRYVYMGEFTNVTKK